MRLRRKLLKASRLYLLIDKDTLKGPAINIAKELSKAGVDIIQLRDKRSPKKAILEEALLLNQALKDTPTLFIVNDYPDIAGLANSDGLHIGQLDMPIKEARQLLGKEKIIGVSCSNLKQAQQAQSEGADYIAIGPVFRTRLKRGCRPIGSKALKDLSKKIKIPVFAIGNIHSGNLEKILSSGINRAAVCRAVLEAGDKPKAAQALKMRLLLPPLAGSQ